MTAPHPAPSRRVRILRLAGWGVSLALLGLAVAALRGQWEAVEGAGGLPGPAPSAAAAVLYLCANATLAFNWRELVALVGPRLRLGTAWWIWAMSQLARYSIGLAQVAGRAVVGRRYGVTATAGAATTLLEIAWYTSVTSTLALATAPWWLPMTRDLTWMALVGAVPAAGLAALLIVPDRMVALMAKLAAVAPVARLTRGRLTGVQDKLRLRRADTAKLTGLYLVNTALRLSGFLVLFSALGGDFGAHGLRAVGAYALGHLVGAVAVFSPSGIGPREGASALVLAPVLGGAPALTLVAAVRLLEIAAELVFFAIARGGRPGTAAPRAAG